jgi:hypothetical protein
MGEAQARKEEIVAMKAAQDAQQKAEAEFRKLIETPLPKEDAQKAVADNDIQLAQLRVLRLRKVEELNQIDHQIELANLDRSVIIRRSMNMAGPQTTAPVGVKED